MSHQKHYQENDAYARFLESWDERFYARYADTLAAGGGKVLDVGCGVGQVLKRLQAAGCQAHGVDVSRPNIERALQVSPLCQLYDGRELPYPDATFDGAGALNVLEHVENPELFIRELARVVRPGGRVVLSSPNFWRVIGWRDYHPRMRGLKNKWHNLLRVLEHGRHSRIAPEQVRFEAMPPIHREPFQPDDDAIIATNPLQMKFFLERAGCRVDKVLCTDRYVSPILDWALNASPLRWVMFNAFLVATRQSPQVG